jgi:hypothetical protein
VDRDDPRRAGRARRDEGGAAARGRGDGPTPGRGPGRPRLSAAGVELPVWPSFDDDGAEFDDEPEPGADGPAPTGSQRGLAHLRHELDEVAAGRRGYVRLATAAPALAAPEQSVVAGFERIDLVEADAMAEIVAGSVDPDRALADHAFAHRVLLRTGASLLVGAGPLAVAPDLACRRTRRPGPAARSRSSSSGSPWRDATGCRRTSSSPGRCPSG